MNKPLIIGIGNEFRSDDSIGLVIAERLSSKKINADILLLSGEGTELMEKWKGYNTVIAADAVRSGSETGKIFRLNAGINKISSDFFNYSTHSFSLAEAVELSRNLGTLPENFIIFGIEGENFTMGGEISPEVKNSSEKVIEMIEEEVKNHA